jgi:hypothetical protein
VRHVDDHLPPLQQRVLHDLAHAHRHLAVGHGGRRKEKEEAAVC